MRIDLRTVKSPIIVFCSMGDNITPPQQALDWILDLYDHESELIASGQTIVYTLHQSIGHLGIFVSGKIATKEDKELVNFMDMIDLLPPGLYEAVITEVTDDTQNRNLINGRYHFSLEARTLGDIRALGGNDAADELRFATVRAVSEVNLGLYRTFLGPAVRNVTTEHSAALLRHLHPNRMRFEMFSDKNPLMQPVAALAESVRAHRQPVTAENPLLMMQQAVSDQIIKGLDVFTELRDASVEAIFMSVYDSPLLQALVGLRADGAETRRHVERELSHEVALQEMQSNLKAEIDKGTAIDAALRALLYIARPEGTFDERGFTILKELSSERPAAQRITLSELKGLMKDQYMIVALDEERAIAALPKLLPDDRAERGAMMNAIRRIVGAHGRLSEESKRRLDRVEALFGETKQVSSDQGARLQIPAA
jgi:hypothetical protein